MSDAKSNLKAPEKGMWNVEYIKDLGGNKKGTECIYHSSTATTLEAKGWIKIVSEVKVHVPKTMKK